MLFKNNELNDENHRREKSFATSNRLSMCVCVCLSLIRMQRLMNLKWYGKLTDWMIQPKFVLGLINFFFVFVWQFLFSVCVIVPPSSPLQQQQKQQQNEHIAFVNQKLNKLLYYTKWIFFFSLFNLGFFWQFQNNCCGSIYQSINQWWWWWRRRRCSRQKRNVSLLEIFSQSTNPEFIFLKNPCFFALDHICCWITYHGQRWKENYAYVFDFWQVIIEWWLFNMIKHY